MIQVGLQLLAIAAAMAVVVAYGFLRDKHEHQEHFDSKQQSIYFPDHNHSDEKHPQRGAAMSRLS
jgi:hypothetical protein